MVKHTCAKCDKNFTAKCDFVKHMNRKNSCDRQLPYKCENCKKMYSDLSGLCKHKKICKGEINTNVNIDNSTKIQNNIDTQNNLKVDGDVKLVKFGNENLSYISDDIFKSILGRGFMSIEELVDHSHFHPDHPENHNIYIANIQTDYVVIYNGAKWNINKKEDVFEDIIYAKSDFLCMKFKELMNQMTDVDIKKFTNFINQRDEDKTMNKIKGELKLQLYNNRGLPQKLRKRMECNERTMQKTIKDKKSKQKENKKLQKAINLMENLDDSKLDKLCNLLNSL